MVRFDRKVERQKKEFDFYKEKTKKSKMTEFKENFSFRWIKINLRTVIYIVLDFLAVSLAFIPLLMKYYDAKTAFILGHGVLTSLLVVLTFYFINKEETATKRFVYSLLFYGIAFRGNVIDCSIFSLKCKKYYNFMELTFTENNITYKVRPDN